MSFWPQHFHLSLKARVFLVNTILLGITLVGAVIMVWYTFRIETLFKDIVNKDAAIFHSSQALETALSNQKGFLSYYLLDKNPHWLDQLSYHQKLFDMHFENVRKLISEPWEKAAMEKIAREYEQETRTKQQVIQLYRQGKLEKGLPLHQQARSNFFNILELCEQFKKAHKTKIDSSLEASRRQANQLRYMALAAALTVITLSLLVNFIFSRDILGPIRKLTAQADQDQEEPSSSNEVAALEKSVMGLIKTAERTHEKLRQSQSSLLKSEKLAVVGRLAAGTAHSIRNPLTSVKMRLFSLERMAQLSESQKDDLKVISTEINQINRILENFLEFARPPRLAPRSISPSLVVDSALHLLSQRLLSYKVSVKVHRKENLPVSSIDQEQFKEVLVNIIINACEALEQGGTITIREEEQQAEDSSRVSRIQIADNGPGIPAHIQEHIFDPFFTTKEQGTGLGLSIALNIINEHKGFLEVSSQPGQGTSFIITLPADAS